MRSPLLTASGLGHATGQGLPSGAQRMPALGCCDCLAAVCVAEFPVQDGWWDRVLRGSAQAVRSLTAGTAASSGEARLLWCLAPTAKTHQSNPVWTKYYFEVLMPQMLAPAAPLSNAVSLARHAVEHLRYRPLNMVQSVTTLLHAIRDNPQLRADGSSSGATDALRVARELLLDSGVRSLPAKAVPLAQATMTVACQVLSEVASALLLPTADMAAPATAAAAFGAEVLTPERCCSSALEAFAEALSIEGAGLAAGPCLGMLQHFVTAAVEPENIPRLASTLLMDHGTVSDSGASARDAAAWALRLLVRDPDDGGPNPPAAPAGHCAAAVLGALRTAMQSQQPMLIEAALFLYDAVASEEGAENAPVDAPSPLPVAGAAALSPSGDTLARYAGAVVSRFARQVPVDMHRQLITTQWQALLQPAQSELSRSLAAAGFGRAVAETIVASSARQGACICEPSIEPLLQAVAGDPTVTLEALDSVIQTVPEAALKGGAAVHIVNCIAGVVSRHRTDTRIAARAMRVLSQGLLDISVPGELLAGAAMTCAELLVWVFRTPALNTLHPAAMDSLFALASRAHAVPECRAAATLAFPAAVSVDATHEKLAIRASCRAVTVTAMATERPPEAAEALQAFICRSLAAAVEMDGVTCAAAGAAATLLMPLLPGSAIARGDIVQQSIACTKKAANSVRGVTWAPVLLPWVAAVANDPESALAAGDMQLLTLWLSLDAVYEPVLRPVSVAAAIALLRALPPERLATPTPLTPIRAHWESAGAAGAPVPLGIALGVALLRAVDGCRTKCVETFAAGPAAARNLQLPISAPLGAFEAMATEALGLMTPEDATAVKSLVVSLSIPKK
eukprot:TRINITY_DN18486_c0_g1_i1.p1 TRINITY_DN18486_c0_g1~~TRINITY_DN18486_c0_g1_i1.p1  ORF type:complete len:851 (+),score=231.36 TRINITY_DN18486_c0_g1_i1:512-3064(+)